MGLDFNRLFGKSVRYPLAKDAFILMFAVQLVFAIAAWFVSGYFLGDMSTVFSGEEIPSLESLMPFMVYSTPLMIVTWVFLILLMPAYLENSLAYFSGKRKALSGDLGAIRKRFLPLLALFLILGLILLACFGGIFLVGFAMLTGANFLLVAVGGLWFAVGLVAGVIIMFMTTVSPVLSGLEKHGALDAIKKSWKIIGKNKLNTFILYVLLGAVVFAVTVVGTMPEATYTVLSGDTSMLSIPSFVFMLVRTAIQTYVALLSYAALVGFYTGIKKTKT
jgi:hypothetical protein